MRTAPWRAHRLVGGDVFSVHALGFFDERLLDLRQGRMRSASNLPCMRRIAQNRLTAVGRVSPMTSQIWSKSCLSSATVSALEFFTPSAMPMAAATPMAGAPRTTMVRMTSATSS